MLNANYHKKVTNPASIPECEDVTAVLLLSYLIFYDCPDQVRFKSLLN